MYWKYGTYQHATNEVNTRFSREATRGNGGQITGYIVRISLSGILHADSVSALTAAITALDYAYSFQGLNCGLYEDNGTATAHTFQSASAFGGIRVIRGPVYPTGERGDYTTYRTYEIELEAEYKTNNVNFTSWQESLVFEGTGGPIKRFIPTLNGFWQEQTVSERSTFKAYQSGNIVGTFGPPNFPGPIWPDAEHREQRRITRDGPVYDGTQYSNYGVSWSYSFESNSPLSGNPGKQPGSS